VSTGSACWYFTFACQRPAALRLPPAGYTAGWSGPQQLQAQTNCCVHDAKLLQSIDNLLCTVICKTRWTQEAAQASQATQADADDDGIAGCLGMFEDEEGKDESWAAPQSSQKPKPKKLTGPWGEYGAPPAGAAQKGGKKRPGDASKTACTVPAARTHSS